MDSVVAIRNNHINVGVVISGNQLREQEQSCGFWKQAGPPSMCPELWGLRGQKAGEEDTTVPTKMGTAFCVCRILKCIAQTEPPRGSAGSQRIEGQVSRLSMVAYHCKVKIQHSLTLTLFQEWFTTMLGSCTKRVEVRGCLGSRVAPLRCECMMVARI